MNKQPVYKIGAIIGVLLIVAILYWVLPQPTLVEDLEADVLIAEGMEWYRGPEAGKAMLEKNGFVVTSRFYHRIFGPYLDKNLPHYVTADSVHRTFHVLFEEHLKEMEKGLGGEVTALIWALLAGVEGVPGDVIATGTLASEVESAKVLAIEYFQVAEALISKENTDSVLSETVSAELALIRSAEGVVASPLFGRLIDYSQFKPRGFYTESPALQRYFRTMSWFGNGAFPLTSTRDTLAAFIIAKAQADSPTARSRWRELDELYTGFLAPCDDLTPVHYGAILEGVLPLDSPAALEAVVATLRNELRDPKINSMVLAAEQMEDWVYHSKGMRVLGKRYLPDSEIFMNLTEPKVAGRGFPTGLDMMAANGSARAATLMGETPVGKQPNYMAGAKEAEVLLDGIKATGTSHYAGLLRVLATLSAPPVEQAPPFVKTEAYADKNLMTSLAAWASTRHAWILHAKQSLMARGDKRTNLPPGYVEPNPDFFRAMRALVGETRELFALGDVDNLGRFTDFEHLLEQLSEIVRKELAGEAFTGEEEHLLREYGYTIARLQGFEINTGGDTGFPWMSLVADVHTEVAAGQCLEVATGGAMPIYTVMEYEGKPFLFVGGVYSYYEFIQPIRERLTDEAWREQWEVGKVPALPPWTASFVAGVYDIETVIETLRGGEVKEGYEFVRDPALSAFFLDNVTADSPLAGNENFGYILWRASQLYPDRVNPVLLEMVRTTTVEFGEYGLAHHATAGLWGNVRDEDLAALSELLAASDCEKAKVVLLPLKSLPASTAGSVLLSAVRDSRDVHVKYLLLNRVPFGVTRAITPSLLELCDREEGAIKLKCLLVLGRLWDPVASAHRKEANNADELIDPAWKGQVDDAVLRFLDAFDWATYDAERKLRRQRVEKIEEEMHSTSRYFGRFPANIRTRWHLARFEYDLLDDIVDMVGQLRLARAVPFLERALENADRTLLGSVLWALREIGTEEAIDVLATALGTNQMTFMLGSSLEALLPTEERRLRGLSPRDRSGDEKIVPMLTQLLNDRSTLEGSKLRVRDFVVRDLAENAPETCPGFPASDSTADRDEKAQEWIDYVRGLAAN